jgi:hypothetical protein
MFGLPERRLVDRLALAGAEAIHPIAPTTPKMSELWVLIFRSDCKFYAPQPDFDPKSELQLS